MATYLVWVLVVSSHMPVMFGDYADVESCQRVQEAYIRGRKTSGDNMYTPTCVQVKHFYRAQ